MTRSNPRRPTCEHDIHVHIHQDQVVLELLQQIYERQCQMSETLDDLAEAVSENTSVDQSAIVLLEDIADRLEAAAADPAAVAALAADIRASSADLAAAVAENTPAAPPVEPPVVEPPVEEPPVVEPEPPFDEDGIPV